MARRSDHTRGELTELAIQSGIKLIEKRGFANFSARAVAADMGYTVGTLYHLFGDLDQFILQINAATLELWHAELTKVLQRCKRDPIQALAKGYITFCRSNLQRWSALYEHHLPAEMHVPEWYAKKLERLFALVETPLKPFTKGDRRKAKRAAKILWAGIHGICVLSLGGKLDVVGAESAETLAKDLVNTFLAGLWRPK